MSLDSLMVSTFKVVDKGVEEPCPSCGEPMLRSHTGRRRKLCGKCTKTALSEKKRDRYVQKKYAKEIQGLNPDQAKLVIAQLELKQQRALADRKVKRYMRWRRRYLGTRPGLQLYLQNAQSMKKSVPIPSEEREIAMELLTQHEMKRLGCHEVLWKPKQSRHRKVTSYGVFVDGVLQRK